MEKNLPEFREMLGMDREIFDEAVRVGLFPIKENGKVDFSRGWDGIYDFLISRSASDIEHAINANQVREDLRDKIRREVESMKHQAKRKIATREMHSGIYSPKSNWQEEGFLSEEGQRCFYEQLRAGNIRIFDPAARERR